MRDIIKPATERTRCRYADLPELLSKGVVGPAKSFGSHCWGAKWGLLVAALADKADLKRHVWIDVSDFSARDSERCRRLCAFGALTFHICLP